MKLIKPPGIEKMSLVYIARNTKEAIFLANAVNDLPAEIELVIDSEIRIQVPSLIIGSPSITTLKRAEIAIGSDEFRLNCSFEDDVNILYESDKSGPIYFVKYNNLKYAIIKKPHTL